MTKMFFIIKKNSNGDWQVKGIKGIKLIVLSANGRQDSRSGFFG